MKFFCDNCHTKYSIADEKVRGKVLKVRCKKCSEIITVRERTLPPSASDTAPPAPAPRSSGPDLRQAKWYYSVNGETFGPMKYAMLAGLYESGQVGDESYVWTSSFAEWLPVGEVELFEKALRSGQQVKPRNKTIGVSGALEAIDREQVERDRREQERKKQEQQRREPEQAQARAREEQARERQAREQQAREQQARKRKRRDEAQHKPAAATTRQSDDDPGRADRLADLRAKLKTSGATDEPEPRATSPAAPASRVDVDPAEAATVDAGRDQAAADDDSLFDGVDLPEPASHDGGFGFGEVEPPGAQDNLFAGFDESEGEDDEGAVPFGGAEAPKLGKQKADRSGGSEGVTQSLLIQLDSINKEGRGKRVILIAAAILLIAAVVGVGVYIAMQQEPAEEPVVAAKPAEEDDDEPVVRTYSKDEQNKILELAGQTVGADEGAETAEAEAPEARDDARADKKTLAQNDKSPRPLLRGPQIRSDGASDDDALAAASKRDDERGGLRKGLDDGAVASTELNSPLADSKAFEAMGSLRTAERRDPIYKPTDAVKERKAAGGASTLTPEQIRDGVRTVRRSVGVCRQRHARRSAPLEARKIYITLEVQPSGRVKSFDLEPASVQHTEFANCMESHKGRWRFASFDGSSQKMRAPFILQ